MSSVAVIGAGAWGTALAIQAARAGADVTLWSRSHAQTMAAERVSPHLPGHQIPDAVRIVSTLPRADLMLLAVPMRHLGAIAAQCSARAIVACSKGFEAGTGRLPLETLAHVQPEIPSCVLTGPTFAAEIAAGLPAAAVVAGTDAALRDEVAATLGTARFRLYGNPDPVGAQIGGAAKNVVAIAAGAAIGAGLGENARAAIVTRGLAEISRLAETLGGDPRTVMGLSGFGDLALTCASAASRNYALGLALGRGQALSAALAASGGVTEGVSTAPALLARAPAVDVPVCRAVSALLDGKASLDAAIGQLLGRPRRDE